MLSAWPIVGHGRNTLPIQKAKLVLAVRCKNRHDEIAIISIEQTAELLPIGLPNFVWKTITEGMRQHARQRGVILDGGVRMLKNRWERRSTMFLL